MKTNDDAHAAEPPSSEADPAVADAPADDEGRATPAPSRSGFLPRGYTWAAVLVEVAIVVIGVLVAFALNSWWQGRQADAREQAHLRALHADFQDNVRLLERHIEAEQRTIEASRTLLALLKRPEAPQADTARALIVDVFNSGRFQPVMGAYEAMLGAGGLSLISDDSLRTALASFASMTENEYGAWFANETYMDFHLSVIADLHRTGLFDPTTNVPVTEREGDLTPLLSHPRFRGHLAMRYYAERDMQRFYEQLLDQARLVVRRLERALPR